MPGISTGPSQPGMIGVGNNIPKKKSAVADIYGDTTQQQLNDYGSIMAGYNELGKSNSSTPVQYNGSPDTTNALANLKTFSDTGGYSDADVKNIRERGISPIRSIYSNAKQNLDRQKVISGGYSPGYAAAITKMARDASQQVSDITGNVNATLAQNIAGNKLSGSQAYGSLASGEAGRGFDADKFNADQSSQDRNRSLSILDAQRGLYGTTPALANTFGNQVLNANQQNEQSRQFDQSQAQQAALNLIAKRVSTGMAV